LTLDDAQDLLDNSKYAEIDSYVRSCPTSIARDPDQLVSYLEKITDTDLEKARAIYVWLAENISYDAKSINKNKYGDNTALGVLKSGKAVCQGYAKLFEFLGNKMGLNIQFVSGYSKNDVQEESWDFDGEECDHAWNMIKIGDEWRVFDATWGAGNGNDDVRGRLVFTKEYSDNWFDLSPYEAIFSHYPEDTSLILTEPRLTLDKFESLQLIPIYSFTSNLLDAEVSFLKALKKPSAKFPIIYPVEPAEFQVIQAPKEFRLRKRKPHNFEFLAKGLVNVFLYEDDEIIETFVKDEDDNSYSLEFMTKEELDIEIVIETTEGDLFKILEYTTR
jgi:hypothetical protein